MIGRLERLSYKRPTGPQVPVAEMPSALSPAKLASRRTPTARAFARTALTLCLLSGASRLLAQAGPTADRAGDLQIGVGYAIARPDYVQETFQGFAAYADFDPRPHFGVEAEFHQVDTATGDQMYQRTYEVGGRYLRTWGPLVPYAKAMIGRGDFNYPYGLADLSYNMFAGGVGADFKLGPYLRLRAEYEYQKWRSFPNGGLMPQIVTFGVAYHFAGKPRYK